MNLREIHITDAEDFLYLLAQIERESPYTLLEPGERTTSVREQREEIDLVLSRPNQMIWVAEDRDHLIGWIGAFGEPYRRVHHSVLIGVGVLEAYRQQGIGTRLFEMLEAWAWQRNIRRLELHVANENKAGLTLYRKMGFQIEGTRRDSYCIDGQYLDEYVMAKILHQPEPPRKNLYPKW